MRAKDDNIRKKLHQKLEQLADDGFLMPGISAIENKSALVEQMIESIRRIEFVNRIKIKPTSPNRAIPQSGFFDPIRAAVFHQTKGDTDESCWLIFLATHFGKALKSHWQLTESVYGAMDSTPYWTWKRVSFHPEKMSDWLAKNYPTLSGARMKFGNHRKYESLNPKSRGWTGSVIETYVQWVMSYGSHKALFEDALEKADNDPRKAFNHLYKSMNSVMRFGRTAKFDYLTMVAKVGNANIEADSAYLSEATGPLRGAKLIFGGSTTTALSHISLETSLREMDDTLQVGMQVLEDSLCNWQKSPNEFKRFRG